MLFCWNWCPFCKKARTIFEEAGVEFHCIRMDQEDDNVNFQNALVKKSGQRKVPNIYINGE